MKQRFLSILLVLALLTSTIPLASAETFSDVAAGAWYVEAVQYAFDRGYMNGVGNSCFAPDQFLTRAMLVTILYRRAGEPEFSAEGSFEDVPENEWYTAAILWAQTNGIVNGVDNTNFAPMENVTREQIASIIVRYLKGTGQSLYFTGDCSEAFKDRWYISPYAQKDVETMRCLGILTGDNYGNFNPRSNATRSEAAAIIMRMDKMLSGEFQNTYSERLPEDIASSQQEKNALSNDIARRISWSIPSDWTDYKRICAATHIVYNYGLLCTYTSADPDYRTPYGVFYNGVYTCAGTTRALGLVLNHMGYDYEHMHENQNTHQWCALMVNGEQMYADAFGLSSVGYGKGEVDIPGLGPTVMSRSYAWVPDYEYNLDLELGASVPLSHLQRLGATIEEADDSFEVYAQGYYYIGMEYAFYDALNYVDSCLETLATQRSITVGELLAQSVVYFDIKPIEDFCDNNAGYIHSFYIKDKPAEEPAPSEDEAAFQLPFFFGASEQDCRRKQMSASQELRLITQLPE